MDENRILTKEEMYALLYEFDDRANMVNEKIEQYLSTLSTDGIGKYDRMLEKTYLQLYRMHLQDMIQSYENHIEIIDY